MVINFRMQQSVLDFFIYNTYWSFFPSINFQLEFRKT